MSRELDNWITAYLESTENSEPPQLYREWTAVSVIASCLQRKCWLDWGTDITFFPNLYVVLVGPPAATRKGTAMNVGRRMLERLQEELGTPEGEEGDIDGGIKLASDTTTREALIDKLERSTQKEEIGNKIYFHSSMTIWSQELVVFVTNENQDMIQDLTDWFDCKENWEKETRTQGINRISNTWVHLFGAITPDAIRTKLSPEAAGVGLTSRMIFVYEEGRGKKVPYPELTDRQKELREQLYQELKSIKEMKGPFKPSQQYLNFYFDWYDKQDDDPPDLGHHFGGYIGRRPTHLFRLSLIMSAARSNDMGLVKEDIVRALDLLERTEQKMGRTFAGYGHSKTARLKEATMSYIAEKKVATEKELMSRFYSEVDNVQEMKNIIEILKGMQFISVDRKKPEGEPSYLVAYFNPEHDLADRYI